MRLLRNLLFALLVVACAAHAQSRGDEAAVRNIPQQFAAAWATHSGHELAKCMSEDVDYVGVGGDWIHGKADFELFHSRLLSGHFKDSTLVPLQTVVRFLRPDLALIHWSWEIQDRNETPRFGLFTMIAEKKDGGWLIIVSQNTSKMPGPNPPELNGITPPIVFPNEKDTP